MYTPLLDSKRSILTNSSDDAVFTVLVIWMPDEQMILYSDEDSVEDVLERNRHTQLTQFFRLCRDSGPSSHVRGLSYNQLPQSYRWVKGCWIERMRAAKTVLSRMYAVSPKEGERFYLRMLLHKVRGPTCFEDVRTYNGITYETFKDAAIARGLLQDDQECVFALNEAVACQMPCQLRKLFATLLVFCESPSRSRGVDINQNLLSPITCTFRKA